MINMSRSNQKVYLLKADESEPHIKIKPGKQYTVTAVSVVDNSLEALDEKSGEELRPARLCGSKSTCVAIIEIAE
jgi:hypothetical protein